MSERMERPRQRSAIRPRRWLRRVAALLLALTVFAVGIALGQALDDGPPPPATSTYVRTLEPLPQQPAATTGP